MQRIIYIQNFNNKKIGEIDLVSNNIAHGLIENGIAEMYSVVNSVLGYEDKMMRPEIPSIIQEMPSIRTDMPSKNKNRYKIK